MVEIDAFGEHNWSWEEQYAMEALIDVLRIRLREAIREDKSGTYGVRVGGGLNRIPFGYTQLTISWGCDPARVDELTAAVWEQLVQVAGVGVDQATLDKVIATQRRDDETALKRNDFWLDQLARHQRQGTDPHLILKRGELIDGLNNDLVTTTLRKALAPDNTVKVVLLPEVK
jgi:zinc protease